ncbi:TetR/AcrR family transcriptional regulator [Nocardioides sp. CFH 31398]|uniref:TetR/AcrR family transcriptional regulator n=1 Tax=Nocardioides sp. CFH 31398 TaxID=2919579 RepID=UPI001F0549CC|nr:TetR/AcrR family transcriptional regulator [Nocardioides sp. CFH 31398]MCH1865271.1 TetR/AcrR family transcriptional regulator [Nocardioides sp. CFH 31398]
MTTSTGGRPRDAGRDVAILEATLDLLTEVGYDDLTTAEVARRAGAGKATIYRRWPSKAELVLAAVGRMGGDPPRLADLPDTGTLRGDLAALFRPQTPADDERSLGVMRGLTSLLSQSPELAEAASNAMVGPFVESQRLLMQRAVDRGEVPDGADVATVARVTPAMTAFRLAVERRPVDVDELMHLVDVVVLPALRVAPPG